MGSCVSGLDTTSRCLDCRRTVSGGGVITLSEAWISRNEIRYAEENLRLKKKKKKDRNEDGCNKETERGMGEAYLSSVQSREKVIKDLRMK